MSMIQCPECNSQVSDRARACPSCGINVYWNTAPEHGTVFWQMLLGWVIGIAIAHTCYRFELFSKEFAALFAMGVICLFNFWIFPAINAFLAASQKVDNAQEFDKARENSENWNV